VGHHGAVMVAMGMNFPAKDVRNKAFQCGGKCTKKDDSHKRLKRILIMEKNK